VLEGISSLRELGDLCESHSGVGLKPDLQRATYVGSCTVGRALARQSMHEGASGDSLSRRERECRRRDALELLTNSAHSVLVNSSAASRSLGDGGVH
jgi:hypothetical protein